MFTEIAYIFLRSSCASGQDDTPCNIVLEGTRVFFSLPLLKKKRQKTQGNTGVEEVFEEFMTTVLHLKEDTSTSKTLAPVKLGLHRNGQISQTFR